VIQNQRRRKEAIQNRMRVCVWVLSTPPQQTASGDKEGGLLLRYFVGFFLLSRNLKHFHNKILRDLFYFLSIYFPFKLIYIYYFFFIFL